MLFTRSKSGYFSRMTLSLAFALYGLVALGQTDSHRKLAYTLIEQRGVIMQAETLAENLILKSKPLYPHKDYSPQERVLIDGYIESRRRLFSEVLKSNEFNNDIIDAYVETYTVEDLRDITVFLSSDAGKMLLINEPKLHRRVVEITHQYTKRLEPQLNCLHRGFEQELGDLRQ